MPAKTWQQNMLGITFRYADGRITVFRSALESMQFPSTMSTMTMRRKFIFMEHVQVIK